MPKNCIPEEPWKFYKNICDPYYKVERMWSKHGYVESANDMLPLSLLLENVVGWFLLHGKLQIVLFSTNLPTDHPPPTLSSNWVNPTGIIIKGTKDPMAINILLIHNLQCKHNLKKQRNLNTQRIPLDKIVRPIENPGEDKAFWSGRWQDDG